MSQASPSFSASAESATDKEIFPNFTRVAKYVLGRTFILAFMVVTGVFIAIIVINYGGYIDQIARARIEESLPFMASQMEELDVDQKIEWMNQMRIVMQEAAGLNQPFLLRCLRWTFQGVTLNFGDARIQSLNGMESSVQAVILERLPYSLMLAGAANLLLFIASVFLALFLSRKYGSWLEKFFISLSPISSTPNWVYGIILVAIFAAELRILPFGGLYDERPPAFEFLYPFVVLKHMILPITAIFLSTFFQSIYIWRTYFLIHSEEDYVELAKAKGLPDNLLERRYILRPTLPYILTSFALLLIGFWQGAIALEAFFDWPGIGFLFLNAVRLSDRGVLVGLIVIFAYLLAISVFLLDFLYALIDPRVRLGGNRQTREKSFRKTRPGGLGRTRRKSASVNINGRVRSSPIFVRRMKTHLQILAEGLKNAFRGLWANLREIWRFPSGKAGLTLLSILIAISIYAVVAIPQDEVIRLWRAEKFEWDKNPKNARPAWINFFRKEDLPSTLILDSRNGTAAKTGRIVSEGMNEIVIPFNIDYPYGEFPQDLVVNLFPKYEKKRPFVSLILLKPDGMGMELAHFSIAGTNSYSYNEDIRKRWEKGNIGRGGEPIKALFAEPDSSQSIPIKGKYTLFIRAFTFEPDSDVDAEMILFGKVYGIAGTDQRRRDLGLALLWGAPVALAFGLLGAILTTVTTMMIAAVSVWRGGWVDDLIQRITEMNMILPTLPMAIMVYYIYSKSVWAILGVMVLLNIFGSGIKNYRASFLQIKESPYIEAARVYGASDRRIIMRYLIPRILPVLLPQLVTLIPGYVFLEATLAYLGVSDIYLPTWGKVINDALTAGAIRGDYYWVLEPLSLLLLTALAFALLGLSLDRILNPRLKEV